jgi:hypothetical protein
MNCNEIIVELLLTPFQIIKFHASELNRTIKDSNQVIDEYI